jgi:oligoribonuclease (3'-5' exoribonuclease)
MTIKLYGFTDFEADGLDIQTISPLEVAVKLCLPDNGFINEGSVLFEYQSLIQPLNPDWQKTCHPAALEMHRENGIIDAFNEAEFNGIVLPTVSEVNTLIAKGFQEAIDEVTFPGSEQRVQIHMAGMGVANYDRPLVRHHMTDWDKLMHYRSVDISGFNETLEAMGFTIPEDNPLRNTVKHRAMADVDQGIEGFNYFSSIVGLHPEDAE